MANGTTCASDNISCTSDICIGGKCTHPLKGNYCLIGNSCYPGGTTKAGSPCLRCDPAKNKQNWSAASDGAACTPDTYGCTHDVCKGGSCTHPVAAGFCLIAGKCYANGTANPNGTCAICSSSKFNKGWSAITYFGCCSGQKLWYCESGLLKDLDCNVNPSCGWSSTYGYYDCGTAGGTGSAPKDC